MNESFFLPKYFNHLKLIIYVFYAMSQIHFVDFTKHYKTTNYTR
jgi:hypothetical protein